MTQTNKTVIITGASVGIGRAIAVEFGEKGINTILVARRKDKLEKTKKLVEKAGGQATVVVADLSSVEGTNKLIQSLGETESINGLINVAGIWHGENEVYADKDFETFDQKVILDTFNVGTIAPTLLAHALVPKMPEGSKIINISGTFENGAKGWLPYFVSKRAIEDLTVGLAQELESKNIQVNCISPSDTATESYAKHFPQYMDEAIEPEKIAEFAVELYSGKLKNETGKVFVVKKGQEPFEKFH